MAASFRYLKSMGAAGWIPAVGDVLRASGKAAGVLMQPLTAPALGCAAPPMVRVLVNSRSVRLQMRGHKATKCTRGNWVDLARHSTPRNARGWGSVLALWTQHIDDATVGRVPWVLEGLASRSSTSCRTRADANRHEPSPAGGPGRGRKVKAPPGSEKILGYSPASGDRCRTRKVRGPEVPEGTLGCERQLQLDRADADRAAWFEGLTDTQRARKLFR